MGTGKTIMNAVKQGAKATKAPSMLSKIPVIGGVARAFEEDPIALGLGGAAGAGFLAVEGPQFISDMAGLVTGSAFDRQSQYLRSPQGHIDMMRAQRLQTLMALNEARLAMREPHLYTEILAGRKLSRGTVLFGGRPRRDWMDEVSYGMASGQYGSAPVPQGEM